MPVNSSESSIESDPMNLFFVSQREIADYSEFVIELRFRSCQLMCADRRVFLSPTWPVTTVNQFTT